MAGLSFWCGGGKKNLGQGRTTCHFAIVTGRVVCEPI